MRESVRLRLPYSKALRLRTTREFNQVFKESISFRCHFLTFRVRSNNLTNPRLGFALSRKHIRTAVQRHLLKRLIREWFRLKQHELPRVDIVVTTHAKRESLEKAEIRQCIDKFWQKLMRSSVTY